MGSMSAFYTREKGNEGTKVPLVHPDGSPSDDYIVVRSVDSDAFRQAINKAKRAAIEAAKNIDDVNVLELKEQAEFEATVALVADWSFDEECTVENVSEFLKEAPHIADAIDQIAANRRLFQTKKSDSSATSPDTKQQAQRRRKGRK